MVIIHVHVSILFIFSFICSSNRHLLNIYYAPGTKLEGHRSGKQKKKKEEYEQETKQTHKIRQNGKM